jgi:hypothetical protein
LLKHPTSGKEVCAVKSDAEIQSKLRMHLIDWRGLLRAETRCPGAAVCTLVRQHHALAAAESADHVLDVESDRDTYRDVAPGSTTRQRTT